MLPGTDVGALLRNDPDVVLSLQKGVNLIPYDEFENPQFIRSAPPNPK